MQIVITGVGGQGVLFLSRILQKVALKKRLKISAAETIGMAQRGGSVISFLKFGQNYFSPMIIPGTADILICLKETEIEKGTFYLKKNGKTFINNDSYFNATKIALNLKNTSMTNLIFLGYVSNEPKFPFKKKDFLDILSKEQLKFFAIGEKYFNGESS